jgi:hypothetical protein
VYYASEIPEVNISALTYFAASIFWRASVYPWQFNATVPVPLGPFEEPLRLYLLGEAEFPPNMTLSVVVRASSNISRFTHGPIGEWRGPLFVAKFPMPGFGFSIAAGIDAPAPLRQACFVRGQGNPIFVDIRGELEKHVLGAGVEMLRRLEQKAG